MSRRPARRRRQPARRRRPWWLLLLLLLVLVLVLLCCCGSPLEPEPALPAPAPPSEGPAAPAEAPLELGGRVAPQPRATYPAPTPTRPPWLDAFRLQVSARGPRLAGCFVGAAAPGALRWTAILDPGSGQVADHTVEPMRDTEALTAQQRDCVVAVLSDPPYRVDGEGPSTPTRVGMAVEF